MMKIMMYPLVLLLLTTVAYGNSYETRLDLDELLTLYVESWTTQDDMQRKKIIKKIWVRRGVHQTPLTHSRGREEINQEIQDFQNNFPEATVKFENIKQVDNHIIADFILESADGNVLASGTDYFKVSHRGRLIRVVGFF